MKDIIGSAVRTVVVTAAVLALYFVYPFDHTPSGIGDIGRLFFAGLFFLAVLVWQIRAIWHSRTPVARALEGLLTILAIFVCLMAAIYLSLAESSPQSFSQPLDHVASLYFSMTVLATVGFGDIVPLTHPARLIVTGQMAVDLILVAAIVRGLVELARSARSRGDADGPPPPLIRRRSAG